jgi:cytochrome c peroxidase
MTLYISRLRFAAVGTLVFALAVGVACGGDTESGKPSAPQAAPTSGGDGSKSSGKQAHTAHSAEIDQRDMAFVPERVSVKVGETVLIKNSETVIHTANINGKNVTGNMKKGDSTPWTAQQPGEYKVTCEYHPQMKATILVTP